jgi:hypothetical protein
MLETQDFVAEKKSLRCSATSAELGLKRQKQQVWYIRENSTEDRWK